MLAHLTSLVCTLLQLLKVVEGSAWRMLAFTQLLQVTVAWVT
jgi:hypothetical protein